MSEADERAAEVLADARERLDRGEEVDEESLARAHPDLADELRRRFAALRRLDRMFPRGAATGTAPDPPPAQDLVGHTLGPYRLTATLGVGGMGTVYLATVDGRVRGLESGERVALKVVHPHLLAREGFFRRFLREAEIGRRVRHENIVRTLHADAAPLGRGQAHFLVMEYVEGRTLRALLDDLGRVPEELCRHVGREVAKALAAIHAEDAVHRDLKPENVLVTKDHAVKVMDLGVARIEDDALSQTGAFVGSVRYAAPEQFMSSGSGASRTTRPLGAADGATGDRGRGVTLDGRADLYALGLVLYELATGTHPFAGDDFRELMRRQLTEVPRGAGEVNPQLSPFFEELVRTLLAKERDDRFASAGDLLAALEGGEESAWWRERAVRMRAETRRPLRRMRVPRDTALYGREAEIARIRALFEKAKAGDGQVVLVEGEAGIGKSRLVDEFVGRLAQAGEDVDFLHGSYPPGGAATGSGAFSTAYREHLGDDESAVRGALPQTPSLVPAFAALLRGDAPPGGAQPLTKDSLQTVFVHATRSFAALRPTIVLIDDLHFAPEEGRALFAALALAVRGHRILLVGAERPGLDRKWLGEIEHLGHATRLALPRLGAKDLVALLRDALRSERLAEELSGKIATKSDGNPFFVFEILRGLREGQFITKRSDGTWATTREIREIEVPSSVVELVQARVSDLSRSDRNVLEAASCVGFEFDAALVGDVLGIPRVPLLQTLGAIEKSHRLVRSAGRRFVFDHHQVMEVLHAGLSEPLREEYHAAIGAAIEARSGAASKDPGEVGGAVCVELAHHFLRGAQGTRALHYLREAVLHLERNYLTDAVLSLVDLALAAPGLLAGSLRVRTLLQKHVSLYLTGRREAERATLDEALALADATDDLALRARVRISLGSHLGAVGDHVAQEAAEREALDLARAAADRQVEGLATGNLGSALASVGRYAEAQECFERSLAIAREVADWRAEVNAVGNLGRICHARGRFTEARTRAEEQFELARSHGLRQREASSLQILGDIALSFGQVAESRERYERSLAIAREIGDRPGEGSALAALAHAAEAADDLALAERCNAESLEIRRATAAHGDEAGLRFTRGTILELQGRLDEARAEFLASRASAEESSRLDIALAAAAYLALLPGGDPADALALLAAHASGMDVRALLEIRFVLWRATGDAAHLAEAKRQLDECVAQAPPECRESMRTNVRLHREIAASAAAAGV